MNKNERFPLEVSKTMYVEPFVRADSARPLEVSYYAVYRSGECLLGAIVPDDKRGWRFIRGFRGMLGQYDIIALTKFINRLKGENGEMQSEDKSDG